MNVDVFDEGRGMCEGKSNKDIGKSWVGDCHVLCGCVCGCGVSSGSLPFDRLELTLMEIW